MNLSLTAVSDRDVQGWVDQFQFSGVPSQYLPEKSSIVGEIQEQAGQTKIEFNNGGGDKLITLELSTTFYSDMIINYQVPLSRNLGEAQITNRKTGNSSTIKCQVNMKGY